MVERLIFWMFWVVFVTAILVYAMHGLPLNQQYDAQVLYYARDLLDAFTDRTIGEYLLQIRKYPMLYVVPFAVSQGMFHAIAGIAGIEAPDAYAYMLGRFVTLLYTLGLFLLQWHLSRKLTGTTSAALLLAFSLLTFMFTSAIRPHLPVAFWTLATLAASLRLREHHTPGNMALAWGMALCAFGTLQSGIFAFVFPFWAQLTNPGDWRSWMKTSALGAASVLAALVVGYPFVLGSLFGTQESVSVDLGHNVEADYALSHGWRVLTQMLGSELIILMFALAGTAMLFRGKGKPHPVWLPVLAYLFAFFATFLFHSYGMSRFFLPTLPLFALLGAFAFDASPRWLRIAVTACMAIVFLKFAWLAQQPNTYERASDFVKTVPGYVAVELTIPFYFTSIPDSRFPVTRDSEDYQIAVTTDQSVYTFDDSWQRCAHLVASRFSDDIVLLWNDTPWALWQVLSARMLGPNISIYCKD